MKSNFSARFISIILLLVAVNHCTLVAARYLPTRSQSDSMDRLKNVLRNILENDGILQSVAASLQQQPESRTSQQQQHLQQQQQVQQSLTSTGLNGLLSLPLHEKQQQPRFTEALIPIRSLDDLDALIAQRQLQQQQQQQPRPNTSLVEGVSSGDGVGVGITNGRFVFKRGIAADGVNYRKLMHML